MKVRERGYSEGQAIGGLVYNLILGGSHLSDLDVLGDPGTQEELLDAETILVPTTVGEFLRRFDIGDVQNLQPVHLRCNNVCGLTSTQPAARLTSIRASMSKRLPPKKARIC